jgi:SAM-dependent methyltransferase
MREAARLTLGKKEAKAQEGAVSKLDDLSKQFDAAYFAGGENKGNAYKDNHYLDTALLSRTYFEMAEIIAKCFKPTRMLEIGCAAGPTIYHLNTFFDIDAHGIDVSEWAVENRLHPHVRHASTDNLPYNIGEFDLVFSCQALEHLTLDIKDRALLEINRVCKSNGIQYHLMPILESGPYADDMFGSIVGLRILPTIYYETENGGYQNGQSSDGTMRVLEYATYMTITVSSFLTASSSFRVNRSKLI